VETGKARLHGDLSASPHPKGRHHTGPKGTPMGVDASFTLPLADAISSIESFVHVFILVYILLIFGYIITSWVRLPYSPWLNRIQRFLYDVCEPYLRLFRRILPSFGQIDLSPIIAVFSLGILDRLIQALLEQLH
jgi:YggT family protein